MATLDKSTPFFLPPLFGRQLPMVMQAEEAECALACLAMIAGYHGDELTLIELRRRFNASLRGTTLKSVVEIADSLGLAGRPVRCELEDLARLKAPAILHWNLKHYVVLKKVSGGRVHIHDPRQGAKIMSFGDVSRSFTGVALELTPTARFQPQSHSTSQRVRLSDLFSRTSGLWQFLGQLFFLAAMLQLFSLLSPILSQIILDDAIGKSDAGLLITVAAGMIMLSIFSASISLLRGYIGLYLGTQLSVQMQTNLLRHTLRLPASWFENRHVGDILSRFSSLSPAQAVLTGSIGSVALDLMILVASAVMMIVYAPLLMAIEVGTLAVLLGVRYLTFPYVRQKMAEGLHLTSLLQTTFLETIRGARAIKLFGRERERLAIWQNQQASAINNGLRISQLSLWGIAGGTLLSSVQQIIVWCLGAKMVVEGHFTIGMLMAFQAYTGQFTGSVTRLIGQVFTLRTLNLHLERLGDIALAEEERGLDQQITSAVTLVGGIEVRNLSFRYAEHDPWTFQGVDLKISPGEFVCIIGPSGGGKTTLLKLLLGFHEPQTGEILVDGMELRRFGTRNYRSNIGVVMQDDQLFGGTIGENIAFFDTDVDMVLVEDAARRAQIHEDIVKLPMGYHSLVGDMGSALSGGQRQRVYLARALYRNPQILFLDEGTANLDPSTEANVMASLKELNITRIVISHRESALLEVDRIICCGGGTVYEIEHNEESNVAIGQS